MKYSDWVVDITRFEEGKGIYCFVPVENAESENPTFITGFSVITSLDGFDRGRIRGIIHEQGQEECDKWCEAHAITYESIMARAEDLLAKYH